ncbi:MAG: F0F1 ATP synthase subunit B [Candidatus Azobacteroides sp.]|nr:F0F1 ATP synthase subunit B [Candidatus Azobacteroides sp.]
MSLLLPDTGLLFWMLLSFGIVFFILAKFGFPVITKMVDERNDYIEKSLQHAKEADEKLAAVKTESEAILAEARNAQQRMLEEVADLRKKLIEEAKQKAGIEADKVMETMRASIRREKEDAVHEIRSQVVSLSVEIAEKIIRKNLEPDAEQKELIDRLLNEVNTTGKN